MFFIERLGIEKGLVWVLSDFKIRCLFKGGESDKGYWERRNNIRRDRGEERERDRIE